MPSLWGLCTLGPEQTDLSPRVGQVFPQAQLCKSSPLAPAPSQTEEESQGGAHLLPGESPLPQAELGSDPQEAVAGSRAPGSLSWPSLLHKWEHTVRGAERFPGPHPPRLQAAPLPPTGGYTLAEFSNSIPAQVPELWGQKHPHSEPVSQGLGFVFASLKEPPRASPRTKGPLHLEVNSRLLSKCRRGW